MIDYKKSAELNSTTIDELKTRFKRFPQSGKKVVAVCEVCGTERPLEFRKYRDLCHRCWHGTPEVIEANSKRCAERWSDQAERDMQSERRKRYFEDQTNRDHMSEKITEYYSNPENRVASSKRMKNSEASKVAIENMCGGDDICNHHHIYDHSDLSKYTIEMTRSQHSSMHRQMRYLNIQVPHINTGHENAEELELMEYIDKIETIETFINHHDNQ